MEIDYDLRLASPWQLKIKLMRLRAKVRELAAQRNQDRCQVDLIELERELYGELPEGCTADFGVDRPAVFLRGCVDYRFDSCQGERKLTLWGALRIAWYAYCKQFRPGPGRRRFLGEGFLQDNLDAHRETRAEKL